MRALALLALALPTLALPTSAAAENRVDLKPDEPDTVVLSTWGEARVQANLLTDFVVDAEDTVTTHGQQRWLDSRIRAGIALEAKFFRIGTEWDLLSGQFAGDTWNLGALDGRRRDIRGAATLDGFAPRQASVRFRWAPIEVEAGLITTHWGLGLLAHDGQQDPWFGRTDLADRAIRLRVTGRPLFAKRESNPNWNRLNITGAFDVVFDDDFGSLFDGQLAFQGVAAVLHKGDESVPSFGMYGVFRHQIEPNDTGTTTAGVVDAYGDGTLQLGPILKLRIAGEGALIFGETSRTLSYGARESMTALSGGFTALQSLTLFDRVHVHVREGVASGDARPDDAFSTGFAFDRNFDVGMVLFDHVNAAVRARAVELVKDPERSGQPPRGIDGLVNDGAASSMAFLQPIVGATPLHFLHVQVGVLAAWSTAGYRHPLYSFRAGGAERTHTDEAPTGNYLGTEFDWSVAFGGPLPLGKEHRADKTQPPKPFLAPQLLVQGGHLLPGGGLVPDGTPIHNLLVTGRFRW